MQVMTVVEGRIPKPKMHEFESQYVSVRDLPKPRGMVSSTLLRDPSEEGLYQISTLWQNRKLLDEMRKANITPVAVALFKSHGVEPSVRVFDVLMTIKALY